MRLRLAPEKTNFDFFKYQKLTFGGSILLTIIALVIWAVIGLNFGIDFKGGTTIRTESTIAVNVGAYRTALSKLELGDVSITQVFDPSFRENQHVAMIRISSLEGDEAVTPETIATLETALSALDPAITFPSVESVG
ncbi:MAG: protein translocase subunit SecF, partial [Paracoccaceae bacterium]|nr:protein translocase subunit SecF [Paracoccaceae bacterium]